MASAQEAIKFRIKYIPNHNYATNVVINNDVKLNFKGAQADLDKIKAQGIQNPLVITGATKMTYHAKTGSLNSLGAFPVTISYDSITNKQLFNGKELTLPKSEIENARVFAHSGGDGILNVDSIGGRASNDTLKKEMSGIINMVSRQIKFPENELKVGDSFAQDLPMNIPMMGSNMSVSVKVIYTLTGLKEDMAYFDISQSATFNVNIQQGSVDMKGNGTGKLIFSVKNSFPVSYISTLTLNYNMNMSSVTADGIAKINASYQTMIN